MFIRYLLFKCVRSFVIHQNNFIRHYLFAKIFAKLFLQHNSYPQQV